VEARRAAESACHFAVLLGLKLAEVKRETAHGGWGALFGEGANAARAAFEFSKDTADRYIKAGEGAMNRPGLPSAAKRLITQLAAEPETPTDLTEAETKALDKATRGETLRQLYIDLGVMRAPVTQKSGTGGDKGKKVKPPKTEDDLFEELVEYFAPITSFVERGDLTQLVPKHLAELETLLRSYLDELKKISKK
jgi:hypothetical protein